MEGHQCTWGHRCTWRWVPSFRVPPHPDQERIAETTSKGYRKGGKSSAHVTCAAACIFLRQRQGGREKTVMVFTEELERVTLVFPQGGLLPCVCVFTGAFGGRRQRNTHIPREKLAGMPISISNAAYSLWVADHKQNEAELQQLFAGRSLVSLGDVKQALRERGLLTEREPTASKIARGRASKIAVGGASCTQPNGVAADPLFLHGNTIRLVWKGGQHREGRLIFRADGSRPRGQRGGLTKYRVCFEGRKPEGSKVSWKRLKANSFEVVASPIAQFRRTWQQEERAALLRRLGAGESHRSLSISLGRCAPCASP